jgi:pyruvate,water dikinase
LPDELSEVHNDLVSGEAGIISLEPVRRMREMAELASGHPQFVAMLNNASAAKLMREFDNHNDFAQAYQQYVARFGDRCMDELKLESQTIADDPLTLLRSIAQMAMAPRCKNGRTRQRSPRAEAEQAVSKELRNRPFRRLMFGLVLKTARARLRDRENLRFERTRVYGRVRAIFVEIGKRLKEENVIMNADDIFFLDVDEILRLLRGTGSSIAVAGVVAARRKEYDDNQRMADPPRRFVTCGLAQLSASRVEVCGNEDAGDEVCRKGQACSTGTVTGPVRIVRDPRDAQVRPGDILVAQRTDPGWVTIFPLVAGMIMERGSLLSHSAIVARELGLPCVVGVDGACDWLEDGEPVEINGATGQVRRLRQSLAEGRAA